jgi:formate/nitrite transporter FocA (FNT family)
MSKLKKRINSTSHEGTILKDRFGTEDVFERIIQVADEEVTTNTRELLFSALAAGFAITLTFFLYASMYASTGGHPILKGLLYPLGFIYIVLGGYQLFTENTLPPIALLFERMTTVLNVLRVWGVVLVGNFIGGVIGAIALAFTGVFGPQARQAGITLAESTLAIPFNDLFFKAMFAGFIVAGVVWLDYSARDTMSRFILVYMAFLTIPLTGLKHIVITFTEMIYLWLTVGGPIFTYLTSAALPVLLGNIVGGVLLVTTVNYYMTPKIIEKNPEEKYSFKHILFGYDKVDKK